MDPLAVGLAVAGGGVLLAASLWLRERLPGAAVWGSFAVGSMLCGAGLLVGLGTTRPLNWIVVLAGLGLSGPLHFRALLGPFGAPGPDPSATVMRS